MTLSPEDIARIQHKVYRAMHMILDRIEREQAEHDPRNPARIALLRQASDMLRLWDWCDSAACWRARRCRRQHGDCYARCAPLLPEETRAGVFARLRAVPPLRAARKQLFPSPRVRGEGGEQHKLRAG